MLEWLLFSIWVRRGVVGRPTSLGRSQVSRYRWRIWSFVTWKRRRTGGPMSLTITGNVFVVVPLSIKLCVVRISDDWLGCTSRLNRFVWFLFPIFLALKKSAGLLLSHMSIWTNELTNDLSICLSFLARFCWTLPKLISMTMNLTLFYNFTTQLLKRLTIHSNIVCKNQVPMTTKQMSNI